MNTWQDEWEFLRYGVTHPGSYQGFVFAICALIFLFVLSDVLDLKGAPQASADEAKLQKEARIAALKKQVQYPNETPEERLARLEHEGAIKALELKKLRAQVDEEIRQIRNGTWRPPQPPAPEPPNPIWVWLKLQLLKRLNKSQSWTSPTMGKHGPEA